MVIHRVRVAGRTSFLLSAALAASLASGITVAAAADQSSSQGRGGGEPAPATLARIAELRRQAASKQAEADRLGRAIADLDAQIAPKDSVAAAKRRQAAERDAAAGRIRTEVAEYERRAGAFDRGRALAAPLQTLRGAAAGLDNFRNGLGQHAHRFEEILGPQVRPLALAGQFRGMADQLERAASPMDLHRITQEHNASILRALRGERQQIAAGLPPFHAQVKAWQDKIDRKQGEVRYWETQKRDHAAKRDDAVRRYNASCHDVLGKKLCADAVAWGQYTYEGAAVAQADAAIGLANGEIALYGTSQLVPRLNVVFREHVIRLYDNAVAQAERQGQELLQAAANWQDAENARWSGNNARWYLRQAEQEAAAARQEADRLDREAAPLKARRADLAAQRQRLVGEAQQLAGEADGLANGGRRARGLPPVGG